MTSPLAQADALVSTDPKQAETLYKQILSTKAGESPLIASSSFADIVSLISR
jgi:hypothetical protein